MSLLPRSHTQFQLKSYWNQFFTRRSTPFEWYGNYADLCHIVHKYVKATSKMLVVGCGNSELSENMYDAGIVHITNIDISEVVIKKMGARNFEKRPRMVFTQMDMLSMTFSDGTFDCVLDKGTLDAIFSNKDDVTVTKVNRMWDEIGRVLKAGGRYMCITLAQEHILSAILDRFNSGWLFRAHKVCTIASPYVPYTDRYTLLSSIMGEWERTHLVEHIFKMLFSLVSVGVLSYCMAVQWILSNPDTLGTEESVLTSEVS